MINKEEIEKQKLYLKSWLGTNYANYIKGENNYITLDYEGCFDLLKTLNYYEARIKELEEINEEHQKLNGELQKKLTYYEDICKGKSIQELGVSDLYKED